MNMNDLIKQAQQFQEKLSGVQQELSQKRVVGSAGAGMVSAEFNGNGELLHLRIEPGIIKPDEVQLLQDLVVSAVNDGLHKSKQMGKEEMTKLTGGLNIPGLT
ncbi:MAG: YbaB/EbfC family nucleoid-associated protein [Desulfobulbus propionicus]|nr:MAG: YbaB/EbfC family nucleoid-associated protein [Desulfobulbus propionicus]